MIIGGQDSSDQILKQLEDAPLQREIQPGVVVSVEDPSEYGKYLQCGYMGGAGMQQNTLFVTEINGIS